MRTWVGTRHLLLHRQYATVCPMQDIYGLSSPYRLEITPINKTVRILAKSTKHLKEALQPILEKYGLDVTRVLLRRVRMVLFEMK